MVRRRFMQKMLHAEGIETPAVCKIEFDRHFGGAINPEWFLKKDYYEVLFHRQGIEYISEFGQDGRLIRSKMYLEKELLPGSVRDKLPEGQEVMNVVQINERNHIIYEIILRFHATKRLLLTIDEFGKIIENRDL